MTKLRIAFMGTPDFAAGVLDTVLKNGFEIAVVVTAPDKPAGRGQKMRYSAVKEFAVAHDLPLLQPLNLKDVSFLEALAQYQANLQIVVAFRMLPEVVWSMPELGTFNLHASLLPDYRGAAPINWAIINGDVKTGVTTFFIDNKIDTGAMILKAETYIGKDEDAGSLHDRLMVLGSETVVETLKLIAAGKAQTTLQDASAALRSAPKLTKENTRIDWRKSGVEIHNLVRGLSPYPVAWTWMTDAKQQWNVKVYKGRFEAGKASEQVGRILPDKKTLKVAVKDGYYHILELQFPGKKKMTASELLNGMSFSKEAMGFETP